MSGFLLCFICHQSTNTKQSSWNQWFDILTLFLLTVLVSDCDSSGVLWTSEVRRAFNWWRKETWQIALRTSVVSNLKSRWHELIVLNKGRLPSRPTASLIRWIIKSHAVWRLLTYFSINYSTVRAHGLQKTAFHFRNKTFNCVQINFSFI